ncbi:VOC family protein [Streptomyces sp. BR123]|uniref:VOC family protein n=1 Tax=Streptomyces sp. BR123 TaxID=2749828 RepID=UPI0015C4412F|nr:VOC family protein [Streptomyces sp. BR123]NXY95032.1 VOC family protein [Streptomyces sp. BR123]
MAKPIPDGYAELTAYLSVDGASEAIAFYAEAFGAQELARSTAPNGKIMHAQIKIGSTVVMLSDELREAGLLGPRAIGGTPVTLYLFVEDVDAVFARAVKAGATPQREVQDHFFGDRTGQVLDPFGHRWTIATHIEDVPHEEFERRAEEHMRKVAGG